MCHDRLIINTEDCEPDESRITRVWLSDGAITSGVGNPNIESGRKRAFEAAVRSSGLRYGDAASRLFPGFPQSISFALDWGSLSDEEVKGSHSRSEQSVREELYGVWRQLRPGAAAGVLYFGGAICEPTTSLAQRIEAMADWLLAATNRGDAAPNDF